MQWIPPPPRKRSINATGTIDGAQGFNGSSASLYIPDAVNPVAVNPDAKLERVAHHNGWPIVVFSKRTKSVVRRTTQALGTVGVGAAGFAAGARYARAHLSGWRR